MSDSSSDVDSDVEAVDVGFEVAVEDDSQQKASSVDDDASVKVAAEKSEEDAGKDEESGGVVMAFKISVDPADGNADSASNKQGEEEKKDGKPGGGAEEEDDEFDDVWNEAVEQKPAVEEAKPKPKPRKRLAPSKQQQSIEQKPPPKQKKQTEPQPQPEQKEEAQPQQEPKAQEHEQEEEQVQDEMAAWDEVNKLRDDEIKAQENDGAQKAGGIRLKEVTSGSMITYDAAVASLSNEKDALAAVQRKIVAHDHRRLPFLTRMLRMCFGAPSLNDALTRERDLIFGLALLQLDYAVVDRERVVQTLYRYVSGDKLQCPRLGDHWDLLGFQGRDPATDLRGGGMLGLLQAMYFFKTRRELALRIHRLSRDERQAFPFIIVSFNLTGLVLQTLREGTLYGEIKKRDSVWEVVNELYMAMFYHMFLIWKNESKTILDFGFVRERLAVDARTKPLQIMKNFVENTKQEIAKEELDFTELP